MTLDIKICGLKTAGALDAALGGGATHVGFIFFPKSPRNIDPETAGLLRQAAQNLATVVAVTVDADDDTLDAIVAKMRPDMLQLHGKESVERLAYLKSRHGLPVMKALAINTVADLGNIAPYRGVADRFLFDAKPPAGSQLPGGNGVSFDWSILAGLDPSIDYFLSGGVNAANVEEALRIARPTGVDISSGVESAPGVKNVGMIADFCRAAEDAMSISAMAKA